MTCAHQQSLYALFLSDHWNLRVLKSFLKVFSSSFAPRFQAPRMVSKRTSLSLSDCHRSSNFNPQSSYLSSLPKTMTTISIIAITCLILPGFVSSSIYYQKPPLARFASQGPPGEYNHPLLEVSVTISLYILTCMISFIIFLSFPSQNTCILSS